MNASRDNGGDDSDSEELQSVSSSEAPSRGSKKRNFSPVVQGETVSDQVQTANELDQVDDPDDFPASYYCPITHEVMDDPVIDNEGVSYERAAIEEWLKKHSVSPVTRKALQKSDLRPNRALKDTIDAVRQNRKRFGSVAVNSSSNVAANPIASSNPGDLPVEAQFDDADAGEEPLFQCHGCVKCQGKWECNARNWKRDNKVDCLYLTFIIALIVVHVGVMAAMTYGAMMIFETTDDFAGSLGFALTVGWVVTIAFMPIVSAITCQCFGWFGRQMTDPIVCPCRRNCEWYPNMVFVWAVFGVFAFIVMTTFAIRLNPYFYLVHKMAVNISVDETLAKIDSKGFIWRDAKLDYTTMKYNRTVVTGALCSGCAATDEHCSDCQAVRVVVRYCVAPVTRKLCDSFNDSLPHTPGLGMCFWFPCRSCVGDECFNGQGPVVGPVGPTQYISEHDWDTNCLDEPTYDDCLRECGPSTGVDGITALNGVKLYGVKWRSVKPQGTAYRKEDASPRVKYRVTFETLYNLFASKMVPEVEAALGRPVIKSSSDEYLLLNWGEQPFDYYNGGVIVSVIVCSISLLIISPITPRLFLPCRKHEDETLTGIGIVCYVFWMLVLNLAFPVIPILVYNYIKAE